MGFLYGCPKTTKTTHIGLSVIIILLILAKVTQLKYGTEVADGIIVSEGDTPISGKRPTAAMKDSAQSPVKQEQDSHSGIEVPVADATTVYVTVTASVTTTVLVATPSEVVLSHNELPIPNEYAYQPNQSDFCIDRFTTKYLDLLRKGQIEYCDKDTSASSLSCFHTPAELHNDEHLDSFCIGQNVRLDKDSRRFVFDCAQTEVKPAMHLSSLHSYWYQTGPRYILQNFVTISSWGVKADSSPSELDFISARGSAAVVPNPRNTTILLKREGAANVFHSLHEMMSLSYTMDVLRMTRHPGTGEAYYKSPEDLQTTQIVILDDHPNGPFWGLWQLFSSSPPMRFDEFVEQNGGQPLGNIIIPLAGAANPVWHDDWEQQGCINEIRRAFVNRVLDFYGIQDDRNKLPPEQLTMTIIERKQTRRLYNVDVLVDAARRAHPNIKVQLIDWALLPFEQQIKIARETDILVGIHGAGMTQAMFMKENWGALVEIMPDTGINCFHAIAMERGLRYFRAHGRIAEAKDNWYDEDVLIDQDKFLLLVDHAVKSLYNRPGRFRDLYLDQGETGGSKEKVIRPYYHRRTQV